MAAKRLVTEAQAEMNTYQMTKYKHDIVLPGHEKNRLKLTMDSMSNRIRARLQKTRVTNA